MKKKVIASLLTVCMLFTLLPTAAFAEEEQSGTQAPVESVEPTAAPSVEPTQEAEVTPTEAPSAEPTPTPEVTETPEPTVEPTTAPTAEEPVKAMVKKATVRANETDEPITITTVEDLKAFAAQVNEGNNFQGKTVTLSGDLDLGDEAWTPIGGEGTPFKGTFDGGSYTVSNLTVTGSNDHVGLFGRIESPAVVKDLTVENANVSGGQCVGALVGSAYTGAVTNCRVTGNIQVTGNYDVGGLTGYGYAKLENCSVIGDEGSTVTGQYLQSDLEGDNVGGLIGYRTEGITMTGCHAENLTVMGTRKVGGLVGSTHGNSSFVDCSAKNVTVGTNATTEYASGKNSVGVGGLIGLFNSASGGKLENCSVENVTLTNENNVPEARLGYVSGGARTTEVSAPEMTFTNVTISGTNTGTNVTIQNPALSGNIETENSVAKVGEEYFETLQGAIAAAEDGDVVLLLRDVTATEVLGFAITKSITIDGAYTDAEGNQACHTVTAPENEGTSRAFDIKQSNGLKATFKNLKIDASKANRGISAYQAANLELALENVEIICDHYAVNIASDCTDAKVSVTDSTIQGYAAINVWSKSTIDVTESTLIGYNKWNGDDDNGFSAIVFTGNADPSASRSSGSTLTVTGSTVKTIATGTATEKIMSIQGTDTANVSATFTGCTFESYNGAEGTNSITPEFYGEMIGSGNTLTVDGKTYEIAKGMGNKSLAQIEADAVAECGGVKYASLQAAVNAAAAGDEVVLLKDIPASSRITVSKGIEFTIDLNGKTVGGGDANATIMLNNKEAKVEIKNGTLSDTRAARGAVYVQQGEVTLTNVTVNASLRGVGIGPGVANYCGKATLNAGTTITATESGVGIFGDNTTNTACVSELVINEGVTITSQLYGIAGNGSNDNTIITINGGTVTATGGYSSAPDYSAGIYHPQQGALNVKGGTISGKVGVQMAGGKAAIEGGTLKSTDTDAVEAPYKAAQQGDGMVLDGAALSLVSRSAYGDIDVTVTGGNFEISNLDNETVRKYGMRKTSSAWEIIDEPTVSKLAVSGGTFSTDIKDSYIVEGSDAIQGADGKWTIGPDADSVAAIGSKGYITLQAAVDAANEGDVVVMLKDYTVGQAVAVTGEKKLTLDLNGKTLAPNKKTSGTSYVEGIRVEGTAELTVVDNGETKGKIAPNAPESYANGIMVLDNAKVTVDGVTIDTTSCPYANSGIMTNGSKTLAGSSITVKGASVIKADYIGIYQAGYAALTIEGGEISGYTGVGVRAGTLNIPAESTAVITGDYTIDGFHYGFGAEPDGNGITIYGAGVAVSQHTTNADLVVNIAGGTLKGYFPLYDQDLQDEDHSKVKISVTGGSFECLPYTEYTADPYRGGEKAGYNINNEGYGETVAVKSTDSADFISGGTFSTEVPVEYCAEGYLPVANEGDTYGVAEGTLGISASSSSLSGGGTVTLTVTPANLTGLTVTYNAAGAEPTTLTANESGAYTVTLPNTAATYTFTATIEGREPVRCTVNVTRYTAPSGGGSTGGGTTTRPTQPEENIDEPDVPLAQPLPFTDVAENDWFYEAVYFVYDRDMMKGIDDGTVFQPAMTTTRGMIVTILHRLEGEPEVAASTFSDVAAGAWYTDAVNWAAANGIVKGFEDGSFRPEVTITRQEMAAILSRYAAFKGYDKSAVGDMSLYNDKTLIGDWAVEDVTWAVGAKVLSGKGNNLLDPMGTTSRAEAAQMLKNFCEAFAAADEK